MVETVKKSTPAGTWLDANGVTNHVHRVEFWSGRIEGTAMTARTRPWWTCGTRVAVTVVGTDTQGLPRLELRPENSGPQPVDPEADVRARWALGVAAQIAPRPAAQNGTPANSPRLDPQWMQRVHQIAANLLQAHAALAGRLESFEPLGEGQGTDEVQNAQNEPQNSPHGNANQYTNPRTSWT